MDNVLDEQRALATALLGLIDYTFIGR